MFFNIFKTAKAHIKGSTKYPKIDKDDLLNRNIRNLLVSVGLLSVVSLVYIILVFSKLG